jgi:signal transduction histidine kinase
VRPPRWSSLVFVAGVLLVLGALGWATFHALRLERLEAEARALAHYQESIRLALWRMDSKITPIIAREAARPYFQYRPFYPADRAYTRMLGQIEPGEVLVPSPLLQPAEPYVKLHFERPEGAALSSPQVPTGEMRRLAESVYVTGYAVVSSEQLLTQLADLLAPPTDLARSLVSAAAEAENKVLEKEKDRKLGRLDQDQAFDDVQLKGETQAQAPAYRKQVEQSANEYQNRYANAQMAQQSSQQLALNSPPPAAPTPAAPAAPGPAGAAKPADRERAEGYKEVDKKAAPSRDESRTELRRAAPEWKSDTAKSVEEHKQQLDESIDAKAGQDGGTPPVLAGPSEPSVTQGQFAGAWIRAQQAGQNELIFTREVDAGGSHLTQGFWLDWPALRQMLLADTSDLIPGASLRPLLTAPDPSDQDVLGRTLAAIPAELVAPPPVIAALPSWSPVRSTLLATWIAALGAMIAIALVLRASMELAERRGRFVSAVTHELRTPLTTFCLYSQMLADGMIKAEEDKRTYARTLNTESQRLARIVESVLEYARLGRRHGNGKTPLAPADLIGRLAPPLKQRCEQAGMQLVVENRAPQGARILADPATLDRVLFNLVDNACKYASHAHDKRIHVALEATARDLLITVRDHGPGLERREQRRIFRPFIRGHRQSDGSIPGLGLGLALSQGLARELRGDLKIMPSDAGAEFRLRVPLA